MASSHDGCPGTLSSQNTMTVCECRMLDRLQSIYEIKVLETESGPSNVDQRLFSGTSCMCYYVICLHTPHVAFI